MIPAKSRNNIREFIARYFIEDAMPDEPVVDEDVRIIYYDEEGSKLGKPLKTEGEIRPTDITPVVAPGSKTHQPTVYPMLWGFTNPKGSGSPLLNTRVETAATKAFRKDAWRSHRCMIPASYYFESEHLTASDGTKKKGQKYIEDQSAVCAVFSFVSDTKHAPRP